MVMKKKLSGEKVFQIFDIIVMCIFMALIIIPVFTVLMTSFVSEAEIARRGTFILIPEEFDFSAYQMLFAGGKNIIRAYGNTLFRTIVGTFLNLLVTISLAYGLSRKELKGRTLLTGFVFFTMLFSGGMIPSFILVKGMGLIDSRWSMVLPCLVNTWNLLIMRNFFYGIPKSLEEAAVIDGANDMQILGRIVLPLSKAVIAVIALWAAVGQWNSYFNALIYIRSESLQPLQIVLRSILVGNQTMSAMSTGAAAVEAKQMADLIKYAIIVVSSAPIMCMYPLVQKYFNQGVMLGSLKG